MTDHLEQAAGRAIDLADRLREAAVNGMTPLGWESVAHLIYLAGLIRGGAATGPIVDSSEIPMGDLPRDIRLAVSAVLHAGLEHPDPKVREAREQLYAAVTYGPDGGP